MIAFVDTLGRFSLKGGFFAFWQKLARQEMYKTIYELSSHLYDGDLLIGRTEADVESFENYISSGEELVKTVSNEIQIEKLMEIINNPNKYNIRLIDAEMFKLRYIYSLSFLEIAILYNEKYYTVRNRVEKVRDKIKYILCKTNV
jgi:hypothetical protein